MRILKISRVNIFLVSIMMMAILLCCSSQVQADQSGGYTYTVTDGKAQITGYTGVGGDVTIPSVLGGAPVTSIGEGAFISCTGITSISFNLATTTIYDSADTIPDTTKIIGYDPSTAKDYATKYNRTFEVIAPTVNIPDPNLLAAVRYSLNKPTGDIIVYDMQNLTILNASNKGISDLTGLECASNLQTLNLSNNQIINISALANSTKLVTLYISYNQLTDITAIAGMPDLKQLDFGCNQVSNITPLAGLNKLEELKFYGNPVNGGDISILSGKTTIRNLHIDGLNANNLSPVATLSNLEMLWANMNGISDLSPLANLGKLNNLSLTDNQITEISMLVNNSGLGEGTYIDLTNNPLSPQAISDIQTLQSRGVNVVLSLAYTSTVIDSSNKVSLHFNENIANNLTSLDELKNAVTFAADGVNFIALGANDTVSINENTIVVTFNTALTGNNNKIKIAANSIKDATGNVLGTDIITEPIELNISLTNPVLGSFDVEREEDGPSLQINAGDDFWASINIEQNDHSGKLMSPVTNLASFRGYIAYDPDRLEVLEVVPGELIPMSGWTLQQGSQGADGVYVELKGPQDDTFGLSGYGKLLRVHFRALPGAGGSGIFALKGGSFINLDDEAKSFAFGGYLENINGQDILVISDLPPILDISSHVIISSPGVKITEANLQRQTITVRFDQNTLDAWKYPGVDKIKGSISLRKNEMNEWTVLDEDIFDGAVCFGWLDGKLVLSLGSGFSFASGDSLRLKLEEKIYDQTTNSYVNVLDPVETPVFIVPQTLGKPLDLGQWEGMINFGVEGINLSYQGVELNSYSSVAPPTVKVTFNDDGPVIWDAVLRAPNGSIVGFWGYGPGQSREQEIPIDPTWESGDYKLLVKAFWIFDPTDTTMAFSVVPLNIQQGSIPLITGRVLNPDGSAFIRGDNSDVYVKLRRPDNNGDDICGTGINNDGS
ncbi:MAG: leucine-rich repeat domain-containing protein, partial [Desulfosporosinus sp.]